MGIFDFVKDAGEKLGFGDDEKKAAEAARDESLRELQQASTLMRFVASMGFPVDDLKIEFDDGVATMYGKVESQDVKEALIVCVGNTKGVARVDDRMDVAEPAPAATMYTVKPGDTLSKIAREHYGDAMTYPRIFEANQPMLKDPNLIYPGQVLRIPPLEG